MKKQEHKKTGIIFDLDGTLLNTLDDLLDSVNYFLGKHNFPLRTYKDVRHFVGNGIKMLVKRSLPEGVLYEEKYLDSFMEYYSKNMQKKSAPYEGIIDLLEKLKSRQYSLAIVSNKFQEGVDELQEKYFKSFIDVAIGNKNGLEPKPSPDGVNLAIKQLNLNKGHDEIFYVGDSEVDIQTAHNAFLPVIAVTWGFRDKDDLFNAEYIVDKPIEIINILENHKS